MWIAKDQRIGFLASSTALLRKAEDVEAGDQEDLARAAQDMAAVNVQVPSAKTDGESDRFPRWMPNPAADQLRLKASLDMPYQITRCIS